MSHRLARKRFALLSVISASASSQHDGKHGQVTSGNFAIEASRGLAVSEQPAVRDADFTEDEAEKLKLIEFSYKEVLDATKHQDDKIGRMLTSVSFLTAASLALAALGSTTFLTRDFVARPFTLPLGLIALAVFLSGVLFTVVLLLTSLATPLRIPGLAETSTIVRRRTEDWVAGVPTSQLYFYSITGVSLEEWERKWSAPLDELKEERLESLIRETHNIGVRTSFKYDRGTEASALLSFSLLSFGLAAIFVAVAAGTAKQGPIQLGPVQRIIVGAVLACYCALQLLARIRYSHQSLDDGPEGTKQAKLRAISERAFTSLLALLVFGIVIYDRGWPNERAFSVIVSLLAVATAASFWGASIVIPPPGEAQTVRLEERLADVRARTKRNRLVIAALTIVTTVATMKAFHEDWYALQLLLAVAIVAMLVGSSALGPALGIAEKRKSYLKRERRRQAAMIPRPSPGDGADSAAEAQT
ncbi:hypothetical protein AB0283_05695 [Micromonospora vinacea]|uniref:hypothetical protein n=1 Tax=Micromonospora vinacea TaxID=709878 RepID=UPI00344E993F